MALDFIRISRLKFAKSEEYHKNKPKAEMDIILCVENPLIKYVFNLTVKLFLSLNGKTSHQREKQGAIAMNCNLCPEHSKTEKSDSIELYIITVSE